MLGHRVPHLVNVLTLGFPGICGGGVLDIYVDTCREYHKLSNKPWKSTERDVARLLSGSRYPANSGGRIDVESAEYVAQVKHRKTMSVPELERWATEIEQIGAEKGKTGILVVKRRAGRGHSTRTLIILTEAAFLALARSR